MRIGPRYIAILFVTLCACAPEPLDQSWKPVDADALLEELQSPTGTIDEEKLETLIRDLEEVLSPLLDTQNVFDRLLEVALDLSDANDAGVGDGGSEPLRGEPPPKESRGTQFFLHVSCPGPDGDDVDFGHGSLRIDSPTIEDLTDESLGEAGDFLLTYDNCESQLGTFHGKSPGYYDLNRETFLLDYDVTYEVHGEGPTHAYEGPLIYNAGALAILAGSEDDSFRVTIDARPATRIEIAGETQTVECSYDPSDFSITCD